MSERTSAGHASNGATRRWVARVVVLTAFGLTLWLFGPRAMDVLAARVDQAAKHSPRVVLDRVGFGPQPPWLDKALLIAVSTALAPWLDGEVPILDDHEQRRLRDGLASVPWVSAVAVERVFPDRLRLQCSLRRPVLAVRSADGDPLCLVDRDTIVLPWVDTPLPAVFLHREGGAPRMRVVVGERCMERRVIAATAIALEWRDQLAPLVPECPTLLEIDTTNLGERWMRGIDYPEVRVRLARDDGAGVVFNYDRPVDSPLARLPVSVKAGVLRNVLERHPRLAGLVAGDLRVQKRWVEYLQPRPAGALDPYGEWTRLTPK